MDTTITKVTNGSRETATLWVVYRGDRAIAQIEKFRDTRDTKNPFKVFSCDPRGTRTNDRKMAVFYREDGGWVSAVNCAESYGE
jgi:hypothetical protein